MMVISGTISVGSTVQAMVDYPRHLRLQHPRFGLNCRKIRRYRRRRGTMHRF